MTTTRVHRRTLSASAPANTAPLGALGVSALPFSGRLNRSQRGALLLEVVVALAIMVAAMGMLGAQLVGGMRMVSDADARTRTAELADRMLALLELDLKYAEQLAMDSKLDGDFGDQYPGYFWHVHIEPSEIEGLGQVTLQVLYQPDREKPDDSNGAIVVRELHFLKAAPAQIDLAADFGMDEEQLIVLSETIQLPGLAEGQLDVPKLIEALTSDPTTLMTMLPQLMQVFSQLVNGAGSSNVGGGESIDMLREMMAEQMRAAMGGQTGQGAAVPAGADGDGQQLGEPIQDAGEMFELRNRMFGPPGGTGGRNGGGRGGNRGAGGLPGGINPGTLDQMDDMPTDGQTGGGRAGNPPAGSRDPAASLQELMRLRDEFNRKQREGG